MRAHNETYATLYDRWSGLHDLREDIAALQYRRFLREQTHDGPINEAVGRLGERASELGIEPGRFRRLLAAYRRAVDADRKPTGTIDGLLRAEMETTRRAMARIPGGVEKGLDFIRATVGDTWNLGTAYDGYCLLADEVGPKDIDSVAYQWRSDWRSEQQRAPEHDPFANEMFWASRDNEELFDAISHYRFYEQFGLGEFDPVFDDVEKMASARLLEAAGAIGPYDYGERGIPFHLRAVAIDLWLVSRTRKLRGQLNDLIGLCLRGVVRSQNEDGSWPSEIPIARETDEIRIQRPEYPPDTFATAVCANCLLRLSTSEGHHARASRAVDWLLRKQNADGSWDDFALRGDRLTHESDPRTTLLAAEAIVRSERADASRAVDLAVTWLLACQQGFGNWEARGIPDFLFSVMVLEFITGRATISPPLSGHFATARGFLIRSGRLVVEDDPTARLIAVIAAHNGVEAFLYGVLSLPSVGISIWKDKNTTLGLREALRKLEHHLKSKRALKQNEVAVYRNDLDTLAHLRDEIVHKALRVGAKDAEEGVRAAQQFVSYYARQLIGRDLLVDP